MRVPHVKATSRVAILGTSFLLKNKNSSQGSLPNPKFALRPKLPSRMPRSSILFSNVPYRWYSVGGLGLFGLQVGLGIHRSGYKSRLFSSLAKLVSTCLFRV